MSAEPTPIRWGNLHRWLRETRRLDDELYLRRARGARCSRLAWSLLPAIRRPLFVVGAPRSGTSFLGDSIGALPEFSYHYEPPVTKAAARYVFEGLWSFSTARRFYRLTYWWLTRRHFDGDLRFAEKTPQNCFVMDFLRRAFADAQFVHIIRDGRDAAASHRQKPWLRFDAAARKQRESGGYLFGPYARFWVEPNRRREFERTSDLHRCAWAWRRHTEAALDHARALPPAAYHELRYEELVADPEREAARLLDFLGISASPSGHLLVERLQGARADSVGRHRRELTAAELDQITGEAGSLLEELGYRDTLPEPSS